MDRMAQTALNSLKMIMENQTATSHNLANINTPGSSITTQCKAVKRIPNSSVQDSSNNNPYYRWNPTAMSGQLLCSDQSDSICTSTSPPKIKNNLATTTAGNEATEDEPPQSHEPRSIEVFARQQWAVVRQVEHIRMAGNGVVGQKG